MAWSWLAVFGRNADQLEKLLKGASVCAFEKLSAVLVAFVFAFLGTILAETQRAASFVDDEVISGVEFTAFECGGKFRDGGVFRLWHGGGITTQWP